MTGLPEAVAAVTAESGFTGVVSVDRGGETIFAAAYGLANRACEVPNTIDTRWPSGVRLDALLGV